MTTATTAPTKREAKRLGTFLNRATGRNVTVGLAAELGVDESDGKYATVCDDHGYLINSESWALARGAAAHVNVFDWCEVCAWLHGPAKNLKFSADEADRLQREYGPRLGRPLSPSDRVFEAALKLKPKNLSPSRSAAFDLVAAGKVLYVSQAMQPSSWSIASDDPFDKSGWRPAVGSEIVALNWLSDEAIICNGVVKSHSVSHQSYYVEVCR